MLLSNTSRPPGIHQPLMPRENGKKMEDAKRLGQRFRAARKARKMTQQELADAVEASLGTVQNLESGKRHTHPNTIIAIRRVLGMEGDEAATIEDWPADVKVITNMIGAWLVAQSPADRELFAVEMTRRIIGGSAMVTND